MNTRSSLGTLVAIDLSAKAFPGLEILRRKASGFESRLRHQLKLLIPLNLGGLNGRGLDSQQGDNPHYIRTQ